MSWRLRVPQERQQKAASPARRRPESKAAFPKIEVLGDFLPFALIPCSFMEDRLL
jgi:hypothetical protein